MSLAWRDAGDQLAVVKTQRARTVWGSLDLLRGLLGCPPGPWVILWHFRARPGVEVAFIGLLGLVI